jgi:hypothetical protein
VTSKLGHAGYALEGIDPVRGAAEFDLDISHFCGEGWEVEHSMELRA